MPPGTTTPTADVDLVGRIARTATEVVEAIEAVAGLLGEDRSCVLIVENNTPYTLRRGFYHHSSGGFKVTPGTTIPPQSTLVFGAQSSGGAVARGCIGAMLWGVQDADPRMTTFWIHWSNPWAGHNEAAAEVSEVEIVPGRLPVLHPSRLFRASAVAGAGSQDAEMRFTIDAV